MGENHFPEDFLFGVASSAYQIEGGYKAEGKGENMYDYYTKTNPKKFHNSSNGNVACDSFNKWREDVKMVEDLGVDYYRFSISWTRILPEGLSNKINENGLRYYNELIDELLKNGIKPMVTMYHWDLPMPLQRLGGWTDPDLANYFQDYARILYQNFGDRVKHWITLNASPVGYETDEFPPFWNQPGTSYYVCNYTMVLAHAKAYHLYENDFRKTQKGKVGITVDGRWYEPASDCKADVEAAERAREFMLGILLNPIFHVDGDFPKILKERVNEMSQKEGHFQSRLPVFSDEEVDYIRGSFDFMGLNVYTSFLVKDKHELSFGESSWMKDLRAEMYQDESWPGSNSPWLKVEPKGTRKLLKWIKDKYNNPDIFVTENGFSDKGELDDSGRINYLQLYLNSVLEAVHEDGVNLKGYTVWSLMDNFEWMAGYSEKFGLYHVDFEDPNRKRTAKKSAKWFKKLISERRIPDIHETY